MFSPRVIFFSYESKILLFFDIWNLTLSSHMKNTYMTAVFRQKRRLRSINYFNPTIFYYWSVSLKPERWVLIYMYVTCIDFELVSLICLLYFGTVSTVWYFLFFIILVSLPYIDISSWSLVLLFNGI
jgi:hypothetical protein